MSYSKPPQFNSKTGTTSVVFQDIKLYIEGVQVPFMNIVINQGIGILPTATIQVPVQAGLMDICRYYQPKVHIFFEDPVSGDDRVLFIGVISATSYQKSAQGSGSAFIEFNCLHKNALLEGLTLDFSGYTGNLTNNGTATGTIKVNQFNSMSSIELAMKGITGLDKTKEINADNVKAAAGDYSKLDVSILPSTMGAYFYRMKGFPGVLLNYWNQLKAQTYADPNFFELMNKLYIPLVEEGLRFFQRTAGHYIVEAKLESERVDPCPEDAKQAGAGARLVPPSYKLFMMHAVQADLAIQVIQNMGKFSGELTNLIELFVNFLTSIEYQFITLSSPSIINTDGSKVNEKDLSRAEGIETVIKPEMPFYFSPQCNVYYPNMYHTINVNQDEWGIPSRITVTQNGLIPGDTKMSQNYRAPASIRQAIAVGMGQIDKPTDLINTTGMGNNKLGKYEQGRGVKHQRLAMPNWLALLNTSLVDQNKSYNDSSASPDNNPDLMLLRQAWESRYGSNINQLNPYDTNANIQPYQRILFAAADYKFTMEAAQSKAGQIMGIFNPYVVPGYPMDILSASPTEPSFHAYCVSVAHTISASSIETTVNFTAGITYTELGNYYLHFLHPWLQTTLKLINQVQDGTAGKTYYNSSILQNDPARQVASTFYGSILGVDAVSPDEIYNFASGEVLPVFGGNTSSQTSKSGGEINPNLSPIGNLSIVRRLIETKTMVMRDWNIKFIDMDPYLYNPTAASYTDSILTTAQLLEPGASQFLDYADINPITPADVKATQSQDNNPNSNVEQAPT